MQLAGAAPEPSPHGLEGATRVLRQFEASSCGRRPAACASEVARQACDVTSTPERQLNPPSSRLFSGAAWAFARCWLLTARRRKLAGASRGMRTTSPGACTRPLTRAPAPAPARPEHVRRTRLYLDNMSAASKSGALRLHTGCGGLRTRRSRPPRKGARASTGYATAPRAVVHNRQPLQSSGEACG